MIDEIVERVRVRSSRVPTRTDVSDLMASIGKPGEARDAKREAVSEMLTKLGATSSNFQGHSVLETLDGYGTY